MKISVSLADEDVEFLDKYASTHGTASRSGVVAQAVALLRANELADAYVEAWDEWADDQAAWEPTVADGVGTR